MIASQEVKDASKRGIERLAKGSYVAKAILYGAISVFALQLALKSGGPDPSRKAVLEQLTGNLLGKLLIALIAIALAGHTVWRMLEIWYDPYKKGTGPGGWIYRLNYLLSAVTYASLGTTAVKLLIGNQGGQDNQKQIWVAKLLQIKGGDWFVMAIGGLLLAWAGLQVYKGVSGNVYKSLEKDNLSQFWKTLLRVCCFVGFITLGGILAGTGWYLIKGAWVENPKWVKNMDDLIKALQVFPGGAGLQIAVAGGLMMMAIFMLAMARYFPVKTTE